MLFDRRPPTRLVFSVLTQVVVVLLVLAACTTESTPQSTSSPATSVAEAATTSLPPVQATTTTTAEALAAHLWVDSPMEVLLETRAWTNNVELADLDGDGDIDILFSDGGNYDVAGTPLANQVLINDGAGGFEDRSTEILGETGDIARVIKVRDVNGDELVDVFIGTTFQTQSRLFLNRGNLVFEEVTAAHLPAVDLSVGDAEFGDVDADGDLDLVLADWGPGNPSGNDGGRTQLWLNDGEGVFISATESQMPGLLVRFSWELEFVDSDGDYDLDLAVSCKRCSGSLLFENDGNGTFVDITEGSMPQYGNNYEFEVMDVNGDGLQDLATINDGPSFTERLFLGTEAGGFDDATSALWPDEANIGVDDNQVVFLDFDSDGDSDFLIASLNSSDRLMLNDGTGNLTLRQDDVISQDGSSPTLGVATSDLNGDGRWDLVFAEGEPAVPNRVLFGSTVAADTSPPVVEGLTIIDGWLHVRVHDRKTPVIPTDWQRVFMEGPQAEADLVWYGEALWRAEVGGPGEYRVCAIDRAGNEFCTEPVTVGDSG